MVFENVGRSASFLKLPVSVLASFVRNPTRLARKLTSLASTLARLRRNTKGNDKGQSKVSSSLKWVILRSRSWGNSSDRSSSHTTW